MLDKNTEMKIAAYGAFVLGAVYLLVVMAAGLVWSNGFAVKGAIASAGVGYLTQVSSAFGVAGLRVGPLTLVLWIAAIGVGVLAGISLLGF